MFRLTGFKEREGDRSPFAASLLSRLTEHVSHTPDAPRMHCSVTGTRGVNVSSGGGHAELQVDVWFDGKQLSGLFCCQVSGSV